MKVFLQESQPLENFLKSQINSIPKLVEVVKTNTAEMQANAQRKAPVKTGFLKRQINLDINAQSQSIEGKISGDANYDPYQEYGTRFMEAHPHIRPAYYEQRDKFRKDIYDKVIKHD